MSFVENTLILCLLPIWVFFSWDDTNAKIKAVYAEDTNRKEANKKKWAEMKV